MTEAILVLAGTVLMIAGAYVGLVLVTTNFAPGFVIGMTGAALYMDYYLVREVNPLAGSGLRWKRHYLPSAVLMHGGSASLALWGVFGGTLPFVGGTIIFLVGFMALLNQLSEGLPDVDV